MRKKLKSCERGATAIEYSLIAALFSLTCIIAYNNLSDKMSSTYMFIADAVAPKSDTP